METWALVLKVIGISILITGIFCLGRSSVKADKHLREEEEENKRLAEEAKELQKHFKE